MKKMRKRDKYLILSVLAMCALLGFSVWLALGDHALPDTMIAGWCAFWAVEVYQIARITIKGKQEDE